MDRIQGRHHKEPLDLEKDAYIILFAYVTPGQKDWDPGRLTLHLCMPCPPPAKQVYMLSIFPQGLEVGKH